MFCKYIFPFCRLPSHFVAGFLCCTEALWFDLVSFVYICFCCLCFWYQTQKIFAKTYVKEISTYVFFKELYGFRSCIQFFNSL